MSILSSLPVGLLALLGILSIVLGAIFLFRNQRRPGGILLAVGVLTLCGLFLMVLLALRGLG